MLKTHIVGLSYGPYGERYCKDFQSTINEEGLCYTWNNVELGTSGMIEKGPFLIQKVKGCGKTRGFRLVVDSQKLNYRSKSKYLDKSTAYRVYVTNNGVVTHKVPFNIDPGFHGEYDFLNHGLHFITASKGFVEWNKENGVRDICS